MSAGVGDLALLVVQVVLDDADRHAEEAVDPAHPLRVAARQVVVDGDDVDALAVERVEVGGQGRDERLAFAGLHLGDLAAVQHDAADELHVEVPHVQHAAAGLADDGEGFGQQIVERLAVGEALRGTRPSCRGAARRRAFSISGSLALIAATSGRRRFSSRSFCVPMTFARRVSTIIRTNLIRVSSDYTTCDGPVSGWNAASIGANAVECSLKGLMMRRSPVAGVAACPERREGRLYFREQLERVGQLAVQQDLVVQVRAGRSAGRADVADHVAAVDAVARVDGEPRQVAVPRDDAVAVVDHNEVAVGAARRRRSQRCRRRWRAPACRSRRRCPGRDGSPRRR